MKTSDFDYELRRELIAEYPAEHRDSSRLLVIRRNTATLEHKLFTDLPSLLDPGDLLVLNNTKVIPARLYGRSERKDPGEKLREVLLVKKLDPNTWECLVTNPKKNEEIVFDAELSGVLTRDSSKNWQITFNKHPEVYIEESGRMPLPPYIRREANDHDRATYQTVFAENTGAIAAPTAGLHFTEHLLDTVRQRGIEIEYITLHVGIGTFQPVKTDNVQDHVMHPESYEIPAATAESINSAIRENRRVVAVGTTVVRTLESVASKEGCVTAQSGETDLFIYPGFKFKAVDAMITNFHLPKSTLMLLVSAFAGKTLIDKAYREAIAERYRFLSYGDATIII